MRQINTTKNRFISLLPFVIFFIGSFIYFGFFGDYILFCQEKSSLFIFSFDFLKLNLNQPGGLLIWSGKFLSAFFYYPIAGAIIVSGILTLIVVIIGKIITFSTGKNGYFFSFIIGLTLFCLQTDYHFLLFNIIGLLLPIVFFCLLVKYSSILKGWIPIILFPVIYYITGGFVWIFMILVTFFFISHKGKNRFIKIIVLWSVAVLTFYISEELIFFQNEKTLLLFPITELNTGSQPKLFFAVAGVLSVMSLIPGIVVRFTNKLRVSDIISFILTMSLIIVTLIFIGVKRFDKKDSQYFYVEKLFYQNRYDEIIAFNLANPPTNYLTGFLNNIVLCEKGKLNDKLFSFPQRPDGKTLFLKWEMAGEVLKRGGYFYYTIGMINEAHRWAFENMVIKGDSPEGLKMLIKTDLINGNYKVAAKYIKMLSHTLFYKKEAEAFAELLYNDEGISADKELGRRRLNRIESDFFSITDDPYINIEIILASDSLNKKAFEYKLAFMLLKKNTQGIANTLSEFDKFGYSELPVHVEEAVVSFSTLNKKKLTLPGNIQLNKNTELRWNEFISTFQRYRSDPKAAEPALKKQFGNTYWYWVIYR
jgi:hypothetical protein